MDKVKKYNRSKMLIEILEILINLTFIFLLVFSPIAKQIESKAFSITQNDYLAFLLFILTIGFINSLLNFPLSFYSSFILEHKYNLSNQNLLSWIKENFKSLLISLIILLPIALLFFYLLKNYPENWWIFLTIIVFLFSILLAKIAPTIIFPLFYKFSPLENETLKNMLNSLCKKHNIDFSGIYSFNLSKTTKKANAGFTGIFKSKRIILSDTLIENFTDQEILTVFAHELGHYKKKHIIKNIFIGLITTFLIFFITNKIYLILLVNFSFNYPYQLSALPLLFLILSIFSLILMPFHNILSRKFEYEADRFAVDSTNDRISFINALNKIAKINLADKEPNPIIEFIFYSHPSIKKRIERLEKHVV